MIVTDDQLYTLQAALLKLLQKLSPVDLCLAESTAHANHLTLAPAIDAGRFLRRPYPEVLPWRRTFS